MKRRIKITVLKREFYQELADAFLVHPQVGKCGKFQDGQVFFVEEGQYDTFTHDGCFCQSAWDTIKDTVYSGLMGGNLYREGWSRDPGKLVLCCRDGIRPVVFLLEKMEEDEES